MVEETTATYACFQNTFTLADYYVKQKHQTEINPILRAINSVDRYSKIALRITCISLYDVNNVDFQRKPDAKSSDWTVKN